MTTPPRPTLATVISTSLFPAAGTLAQLEADHAAALARRDYGEVGKLRADMAALRLRG